MQKIDEGHIYFETQKANEKVLMVVRRHPIVYVPAFLIAAAVYAFALGFFLSLDSIGVVASNESLKAASVAFTSIFLLFVTLSVYVNWLVNYLNIQIVTNEHVVDVDQLAIFSRKISELVLNDIQDVSATKKGIIQTFFNYGEVCIQTAGERPNFNFEKVPDPDELARRVMEIRDEYGGEGGLKDSVTPERSVDNGAVS